MGIAVVLLIALLVVALAVAALDYMDFLKKPEVKADVLSAESFIAFTFQGSFADITRCTEYSLKTIYSAVGEMIPFNRVFCFFHNSTDENQLSGSIKYTIMFPMKSHSDLLQIISTKEDTHLFVFNMQSTRVASSSFSYHNILSYSLGQIRVYPFMKRYAKDNGINDINTVIECYETGKPIQYYMILERTEEFNVLRSMQPICCNTISF